MDNLIENLELFEQTLIDYLEKNARKDGEVLELLADIETGAFSGHWWACNCAYSAADLYKNGDRHLTKAERKIVDDYFVNLAEIKEIEQQEDCDKRSEIENYICNSFQCDDETYFKILDFLDDKDKTLDDIINDYYEEEILEIIETITKE